MKPGKPKNPSNAEVLYVKLITSFEINTGHWLRHTDVIRENVPQCQRFEGGMLRFRVPSWSPWPQTPLIPIGNVNTADFVYEWCVPEPVVVFRAKPSDTDSIVEWHFPVSTKTLGSSLRIKDRVGRSQPVVSVQPSVHMGIQSCIRQIIIFGKFETGLTPSNFLHTLILVNNILKSFHKTNNWFEHKPTAHWPGKG